ncbi:hypothetical protein PGT21_005774 [Puccinia graminis f. sp. tritici]|uniref:Uncharacterized protein n=1 Tax=Puccinia graminis f. sp. tritici TaxID=56615 RepID=A0A5B0LTR4_PUCGR|nr:hypothetical protein PGT21_005774 [Puccinia graminis f. sp. tritici]KAA1137768.1 hypothetical protein PGTUg99_015533 [Puccinia graminis f. sp. tritici]
MVCCWSPVERYLDGLLASRDPRVDKEAAASARQWLEDWVPLYYTASVNIIEATGCRFLWPDPDDEPDTEDGEEDDEEDEGWEDEDDEEEEEEEEEEEDKEEDEGWEEEDEGWEEEDEEEDPDNAGR